MPPWHLRLWCWLLGHRWIGEARATPIIPLFALCRRCGKWERLPLRG